MEKEFKEAARSNSLAKRGKKRTLVRAPKPQQNNMSAKEKKAFDIFTEICHEEFSSRYPEAEVSVLEFFRGKCREKWRALGQEDTVAFYEMVREENNNPMKKGVMSTVNSEKSNKKVHSSDRKKLKVQEDRTVDSEKSDEEGPLASRKKRKKRVVNEIMKSEKSVNKEVLSSKKKKLDVTLNDTMESTDKEPNSIRKKKRERDPNMPKRGLSGYLLFSREERPKVFRERPDLLAVPAVSKELGRRWSIAAPEVKAKFEAKAKIDQNRYSREKAEYKRRST